RKPLARRAATQHVDLARLRATLQYSRRRQLLDWLDERHRLGVVEAIRRGGVLVHLVEEQWPIAGPAEAERQAARPGEQVRTRQGHAHSPLGIRFDAHSAILGNNRRPVDRSCLPFGSRSTVISMPLRLAAYRKLSTCAATLNSSLAP